MKTFTISLLLALYSTLTWANETRNLSLYPLTKKEQIALDASIHLARELGLKVSPQCVNASVKPDNLHVFIQFFNPETQSEASSCTDPHFSIKVEFNIFDEIENIVVIDT